LVIISANTVEEFIDTLRRSFLKVAMAAIFGEVTGAAKNRITDCILRRNFNLIEAGW
jgi:hypothetical protein